LRIAAELKFKLKHDFPRSTSVCCEGGGLLLCRAENSEVVGRFNDSAFGRAAGKYAFEAAFVPIAPGLLTGG
jgi:hypothetical protein